MASPETGAARPASAAIMAAERQRRRNPSPGGGVWITRPHHEQWPCNATCPGERRGLADQAAVPVGRSLPPAA
eukprot:11540656-Alexandrium_andersonii.AAC.1